MVQTNVGTLAHIGWLLAAINFGTENADVGKVTITLGKIEAVAHNELIRHFKPDIIDIDTGEATAGFIEHRAHLDAGHIAIAHHVQQVVQRQTRIDNVFDNQDVTAFDAFVQVL